MTTSKTPSRRKTAFKLPTLAVFKRFGFGRKARVFRDWARIQEGGYKDISPSACALARFGRALSRESVHGAIDKSFVCSQGRIVVLDERLMVRSPIWAKGGFDSTFAALTKRLDTYIAKHYPKS